MGKLAVVAVTDGNFNIHSEHDDAPPAIMEYLSYDRALWGDKSVKDATICIVDENLCVYDNRIDHITHPQAAE